MSTAFLYIRVSTDEQANKRYSQRNQDEVLNRHCKNKAIVIERIIYEDYSSKSFNRPAWKETLREIKKGSARSRPDYILFTKWDKMNFARLSLINKERKRRKKGGT